MSIPHTLPKLEAIGAAKPFPNDWRVFLEREPFIYVLPDSLREFMREQKVSSPHFVYAPQACSRIVNASWFSDRSLRSRGVTMLHLNGPVYEFSVQGSDVVPTRKVYYGEPDQLSIRDNMPVRFENILVPPKGIDEIVASYFPAEHRAA